MAASTTLTGSHLLARALQQEGVENVFTLAGDHILPAMDVMSDKGLRFIDTHHEQAAVHMADAWGRITGAPGVAMYTTPGFANAIPGLADALNSESPVLSISGSAELHELGRVAMQEIDQVGMARPTTKGAWMVTDATRIPDMVSHALRVAYSGRRGPVHLTIPVDIQRQEVSDHEVAFYEPWQYRDTVSSGAPADQVRSAIDLLRTASRPLVIAVLSTADGRGFLLSGTLVAGLPSTVNNSGKLGSGQEVRIGEVPDRRRACTKNGKRPSPASPVRHDFAVGAEHSGRGPSIDRDGLRPPTRPVAAL